MKNIYKILLCLFILFFIISTGCIKTKKSKTSTNIKNQTIKKKILYVDSYHPEFEWVQLITKGITEELNIKINIDGNLDCSQSDVELMITHMDTKTNKNEKFKIQAALKAKKIIEIWKPDIVIVSDDNAAKYLIVPYYKNANLPFVFCGINWDASIYGFPFDNVTGMVEVMLVDQLIETLKKYAKGSRIGILTVDTLTEKKNISNIQSFFNLRLISRIVNTMDDFKRVYKEIQDECDILLITEMQSLKGYDKKELINFINNNTKIPTGTMFDFMAPFVLISYAATGYEHGQWAAQTALKILNGTPPNKIPITTNKQAKIYINMTLANKLDIIFPMDFIEQAVFTEEEDFF